MVTFVFYKYIKLVNQTYVFSAFEDFSTFYNIFRKYRIFFTKIFIHYIFELKKKFSVTMIHLALYLNFIIRLFTITFIL